MSGAAGGSDGPAGEPVMRPKTHRLFLALWPDDAVRARLAEAAGAVRVFTRGKPVADDNLHMTLAFLGRVPPAGLECVLGVAAGLSGEPFTLRLDRAAIWRRSGILWLAPSAPPPALHALARDLWAGLAYCGFRPDYRRFRAHVTVARSCAPAEVPAFEPVEWPVPEFALVESETLPEGARYTVRRRWPLARESA